MRKHWNFKENAKGRIIRRTRFCKSYGPFAANKYHIEFTHRTVFISANNFCCERNGTPPQLRDELRCMATVRNVFVTTHTHNISVTVQAHLHNVFPLQQARHSSDFPQHSLTVTSHLSVFATLSIVLASASKL